MSHMFTQQPQSVNFASRHHNAVKLQLQGSGNLHNGCDWVILRLISQMNKVGTGNTVQFAEHVTDCISGGSGADPRPLCAEPLMTMKTAYIHTAHCQHV